MKKLIILTFAMIGAIVANAASYNWKVTASNIYTTTDKVSYSKMTTGSYIYLFMTETGGSAVVGTAGTAGTLTEGAVAAVAIGSTAGKADTAVFSVSGLSDTATTYDVFFRIVNDNYYFDSKVLTEQEVSALESGTTLTFGSLSAATQTASNWKAVPEPTSGLLLLLGMAGLALRRKCA